MQSRDKWNIVHAYRNLVAIGAVPDINCPNCDNSMVPLIDKNGDPAFLCMAERSVVHIGLHVYDQMQKNIAEWNASLRPMEKND